jgi:hypothetical protein
MKKMQENEKLIRVAVHINGTYDSPDSTTTSKNHHKYYMVLLEEHPDWTIIDYYYKDQFSEMITDAKSGKFDLIIAKSFSSFARNPVDCITVARELLRLKTPVGVYFGAEVFNTLDAQSDFILTMLALLAEAEKEKRSIAAKRAWQKRKEMLLD